MIKSLFQKNREVAWLPQWPTTWKLVGLGTEEKRETFIVCAYTLIGCVLGADGKAVRKESDALKEFTEQSLGLKGTDQMMAMNVALKAGRGNIDAKKYAQRFAEYYGTQPKVLKAMIETMLFFAWSDNEMGEDESQLIEITREIFGIAEVEFHELDNARIAAQEARLEKLREKNSLNEESHKKLRRKFKELTTTSLDRSYLLLGVEVTATNEEIKSRYRDLVFHCHPDRIGAREKNKRVVAEAREQFQKILRAYETIRKQRGM